MQHLDRNVQRYVTGVASDYLVDTPVLLLEGARAVGKSTTMHSVGEQLDYQLFDLDQPSELNALKLDSSIILGNDGLVGIDEYQKLPVLLDEIKAQLNISSQTGQFLLAGSTREDSLPQIAQSLTGRISKLQVLPLAQAELEGNKPEFISSIFSDAPAFFTATKRKKTHLTKSEYIERVVAGGFPLALSAKSEAARLRWFKDYLRLIFERDSHAISRIHNHNLLREIFGQISAHTSAILNVNKIASINSIDHHTASSYISVLENLFLVRRLPAWGKRAVTGAIKMSKIHVLDSGVAAYVAHLGPEKLLSDNATYASEFGLLLETFALGEIAKEVAWQTYSYNLAHWRSADKEEVDIIVENEDGKILAIEIKASSNVNEGDFHSIEKLAERIGSSFCAGIVLYLGNQVLQKSDNTFAAPLDVLWSTAKNYII